MLKDSIKKIKEIFIEDSGKYQLTKMELDLLEDFSRSQQYRVLQKIWKIGTANAMRVGFADDKEKFDWYKGRIYECNHWPLEIQRIVEKHQKSKEKAKKEKEKKDGKTT